MIVVTSWYLTSYLQSSFVQTNISSFQTTLNSNNCYKTLATLLIMSIYNIYLTNISVFKPVSFASLKTSTIKGFSIL